jgi:hypothetical protein
MQESDSIFIIVILILIIIYLLEALYHLEGLAIGYGLFLLLVSLEPLPQLLNLLLELVLFLEVLFLLTFPHAFDPLHFYLLVFDHLLPL